MLVHRFGLAALLLAAVPPALAQSTAPAAAPATTRADSARSTVLFVNPFAFVLSGVSGEVEHVVSPVASLAIGGSYYSSSTADFSSVTGKLRFYPQERAPAGFSVALGAGIVRPGNDFCSSDGCGSKVFPSAGVEIGYAWLLGPTQHFVVGLSLGLQRAFDVGSDFDSIYPMGRFGIGYAF